MLADCFFSPLLSLLSHLHYTPISLGWIKSAIKTSVHVSVKDMRHINSTHTRSNLLSRGGFYNIHICSACFFVVCIFRCACLCSYTCIPVFVYVKGAKMQQERQGKCFSHSTLGSTYSDAWQMIRNGFYWHCKCVLHRQKAAKGIKDSCYQSHVWQASHNAELCVCASVRVFLCLNVFHSFSVNYPPCELAEE